MSCGLRAGLELIRIHINWAGRKPARPMPSLHCAMPKSFDFRHAPGHLIRRAHQLAVAVFMEETAEFGVTPVQFAILNVLIEDPGEDQVTLAGKVAFDAATFGSVIGRLEAKG